MLAASATSNAADIWVELGPATPGSEGFTALARTTVESPTALCPQIVLDGKSQPMTRWTVFGKFDGAACQAVIPPATKSASIDGRALPRVRRNPKKILVLGDTGCRIKNGSDDGPAVPGRDNWRIQNCADAKDWPFATVAANAAKEKPDLVIHVGDYLYRESDCTGQKGCPGGPFGDHLATWRADFFTPAKPLLEAAPWIFLRGNHETCYRSGDGWFSLLDTGTTSSGACIENAPPFMLTIGGMKYAVMDNSDADDVAPTKPADRFGNQVALFTDYLKTISAQNMNGGWLLSHRPVWSLRQFGKSLGILNAVLDAAWKQAQPAGIGLLIAGHTHTFEMLTFPKEDARPAQLVIGNGGTTLHAKVTGYSKSDPIVQAAHIEDFEENHQWGYSVFKGKAGNWKVAVDNENAHKDLTCKIQTGKAKCSK